MKLGITGATGLIGRHVAALAREQGHEVIAFTRDPARRGPGWRRFDHGAPPDLTGCEAILNLAGESVAGLWTAGKRRAIRDSRILGTRSIVEAMKAMPQPPRILVNASATGFYGDTGEREAGEDAPRGQGFLAEVCGEWEAEALRAREPGARVVLLRTGLVLSPEGGMLKATLPIFRLGLGGRLGSGRQWLSWIHIEDEAALALEAVENDSLQGPLNAVAPAPARNAEFTAALAGALRRPAFFAVPAIVLRTALGDFSAELLESRRVIPVAAAGYRFRHPDLRGALENLLR